MTQLNLISVQMVQHKQQIDLSYLPEYFLRKREKTLDFFVFVIFIFQVCGVASGQKKSFIFLFYAKFLISKISFRCEEMVKSFCVHVPN